MQLDGRMVTVCKRASRPTFHHATKPRICGCGAFLFLEWATARMSECWQEWSAESQGVWFTSRSTTCPPQQTGPPFSPNRDG